MKRWSVVIVVAGALVAFGVSRVERYPERGDLGVYCEAGRAIIAGGDLYTDSHLGAGYLYPPFFALAMVPFSVLPVRVAAAAWYVLNLGAVFLLFATSFYLVERPRGMTMAPWLRAKLGALWRWKYSFVLLATAAITARFWLHELRWGNINNHVWALSLLGVYFAFVGKRAAGGAALGLAVATKVMTAPVLLFLLVRKEYRAVLWAAAFVAALCIVPAAAVGWERNAALLGVWYEKVLRAGAGEYYFFADHYNQSLPALGYGYAKLWGGGDAVAFFKAKRFLPIFNWATRAALVSFVVVALFRCRRRANPGGAEGPAADNLLLSIIVLSGLLLQPVTWAPYYVGTVFPYMTVLYALRGPPRPAAAPACYALVAFSFVAHTLVSTDLWGPKVDEFGYLYKIITWGVLALYAAVVILVFGVCRRRY